MGSASPFLDGSRGAHARAARNQRSQRARPRDKADTKGRCWSPEIAHQVQHPPKTSEAGPGESPRREGTQDLSPRARGRRTTSSALAAPDRWRPSTLGVPTRPGSRGERGRTWSERPGIALGRRGRGPGPIHGRPRPSGSSRGHPGLLLPGTPPGANPIQCVSPRPRTHPLPAGAGATGADAALPCCSPRAQDYISHKAAAAQRGAAVRVRSRESAGGRGDSNQRTGGTSSMAA